MPAPVADSVNRDIAAAPGFGPAHACCLRYHRRHLVFVKPGERRLVTADLIRRTGA